MKKLFKKLGLIVAGLLVAGALWVSPAMGARTDNSWIDVSGQYLKTTFESGINILINGSNKYLNFGSLSGSSGYGFRDLGGVMQFKDNGGSWAAFGTGSGSGGVSTTTANIWSALNTFNGGLTIGNLTGLLQGVNGVVSATSSPTITIITATSTNATSTLPNLAGNSLVLTKNSLGVTQNLSYGLKLDNTTAASSGNQQMSPAIVWSGKGWSTAGAGSSQTVAMKLDMLPVQGASGATGLFQLSQSKNNAAFSNIFTVDTAGQTVITIPSGVGALTGLEINGPFANSTPGTTRGIKLVQASGVSFIDFNSNASTIKSSIGSNMSNGDLNFYAGSNATFTFYNNPTSPSLYAQIYSGGFYNQGGAFNGGSLTAGQANTSPPSTFTNYGSTGLKVTKVTTSGTLTGSYTQILADASSSVCTGTPSVTTCSTYTGSGQATCESHLPCSWNAGSNCSAFDNESGMSTCSGTSGCSVQTGACSGGDQATCEAGDDSYGGSCSWGTTGDCSPFDEGTCGAYSGQCTQNYGDCSPYSDGGGDGSACAGYNAGCSYDSGSGTCSGTPFLTCSGNYNACSGNYNTGSCTGTYGTSCDGTATCSGYGSSGACGGEAGCTWTAGITLTMPADSADLSRTYWIKKISSGLITILPNTGQTIEGVSSLATTTTNISYMLTYYRDTADCSAYSGNESTCGSTSGCTQNYSGCTWNGMSCEGGGSCTGQGDEGSCLAYTYFSSCSGTYVSAKTWYIMSQYRPW